MIAKGNPHNSGPYLARYLAADSKGNERAELHELRGFAVDNIFDALALVHLEAQGSRCQNPLFHVQVRLPEEEGLTREQWQRVAERIERKLGFHGQPRAMVFHQKQGHEHMHLVWSRLGEDHRAIDPGLYKKKLKEACRALEKEMGLTQVRNERGPEDKTKAAKRPEFEESRRLKTDLHAIRETIRECWDHSDNGASFSAALEDKGLVLARGDRRAFVIVDAKGGMHALSKRITGATAHETRNRLADIDAASLPSIDQAKAMQRARPQPSGQETKAMPEEPVLKEEELAKEEEQKREAIRQAEEAKREAIQKEEDEKLQAIREEEERKQKILVEEDQKKQEAIKEAAQKQEEQRRAQFKEQADRLGEQAKIMEQQQLWLDAYKAELARQAEEGRLQAERERQAQETARARALEIRNPHSRYGQALAQHYDIKDPYASLARSAMAEYGAFLRDRENLDRQIAQAKDPDARRALELRKEIESAEYMAITSERIATQSEIIIGRKDTEEALNQRKRAEVFRKEAEDLRKEYHELQKNRALRQSQPAKSAKPAHKAPEPTSVPKEKTAERRAPTDGATRSHAGAHMVEERPKGAPRGAPQSLNEFVKNLSLPAQQAQQKFTPAQIRNDPAAKRAHYAQLVAEQKRGDALDRIGEDMRAGRNISAEDIRKLSSKDIEGLKSRGDDHLKQLIQERQKQRAQEQERER